MITNEQWLQLAVDEDSSKRLAERGLVYRTVSADAEGYADWIAVVARGFLENELSPEQTAAARLRNEYRRNTGVYDTTAPMADSPVATLASWRGLLSLPGGTDIPACAISSVTVSPTHRRRGVARALLEGELRLAASASVPVAMLTVSESPLYGRYGFASAASATSWKIDTNRVRWIGPTPDGRIDFITRQSWAEQVSALHEQARTSVAGEIEIAAGFWRSISGTDPDAKDPGKIRAIQYRDAAGVVRGLALYSVTENLEKYDHSTVNVSSFIAQNDDAYAALWRFLLELDLIATVNASELAVDEPLLWMIDDQRAASVTVIDHQYVRILDVVTALEARSYSSDGEFVLEVTDPLGFAAGEWMLSITNGVGRVELVGSQHPSSALRVSLGIVELSALYLGGVSAVTLARAGRITTADPHAVARAFAWPTAPRLSVWY